MYIPEFWAGVIVTLFCEFVITGIMVAISVSASRREEENRNESNFHKSHK